LGVHSKRAGKGHQHHSYWWLGEEPPPGIAPEADDEVDLSPWLERLMKAFPPPTPLDEI
jgi:hypothetical protein